MALSIVEDAVPVEMVNARQQLGLVVLVENCCVSFPMALGILDVGHGFFMETFVLVRKLRFATDPVLGGAALFVGVVATEQGHALQVPQEVPQFDLVTDLRL